jgi:hypothetical protein
MDWNMVGAIGEIGGAIGVIATLIYLAGQLRQNTRQMEFETRSSEVGAYQEMTRRLVETRHALMTDTDLSRTLNKVRKDEQLTAEEARAYSVYVLSLLHNADAAFYQYEKELLSLERTESLMMPLLRHFRDHVRAQRVWESLKHEFVEEFRIFLDTRLLNQRVGTLEEPVQTASS